MARYYFLASSLPSMPSALGERLAMPFPEVCQLILRNIEPGDEPLVRACLLAIDTANAEFFLKGQDVFLTGGILAREEIEGKRGLPSFMKTFFEDRDRGVRRGYGYDNLWEGYYGYAYSLAGELNCRFLIDYLSWEIGLRNSLVGLRARVRGEEAEDYQVMVRAGGYDHSATISQLKMQQNPLNAEQFLDGERLKRIYHCEGPDPFSRDSILGSLERAKIYSRWEKLNSMYQVSDII
jgi:hypothetical protein